MSRSMWFLAGAGAGAYALVRARRTAEAFTPEGLRDRLAGLSVGARLFQDEVRAGMAEKETDVRTRLRIAHHGTELSEPQPAIADRGSDRSASREGSS
jgi:hypothetical protein